MRLLEKDSYMQDNIDIEKLKLGDKKTFQLFFEYFYPKLMALACRFVDEHTAKDLVQEIFTSYWENKQNYLANNIEAYLYKSLQHSCLNHLKHQMVVDEYQTQVRLAEARMRFWTEKSDSNEVWKQVTHQNIREIIEASANKLPPKCREAFYLCYFHDMSHKQIAEVMGISTRTVETHIRQAIHFLRTDLKDLFILFLFLSLGR